MAKLDEDKSKFKLRIMIVLALLLALNLSLYIPLLLINKSNIYSAFYLLVSVLAFILVVRFFYTDLNLKKNYSIVLVSILIIIVIFPFMPIVGNIAGVPNVEGENQSDAVNILTNAKLGVYISYVPSEDSQQGKVIKQVPKSGFCLYKGSKVNLQIGTTLLTTILSPSPDSNISSVPTKINGTIIKNLTSDEKVYVFVKPLPRTSDGLSSEGPYEWYTQPDVYINKNVWMTNIYLGHKNNDFDINRNYLVAVIVSKENITTNTVYGFNLPRYESIQNITLTRI